MDHVVCTPRSSETNKDTKTEDDSQGDLLARVQLQRPEHGHREDQDAHVKGEVEDGAEEKLHAQVAAVLQSCRADLPVVLDRPADSEEGYRAADQVRDRASLEEVDYHAELLHGEDLRDEVEDG